MSTYRPSVIVQAISELLEGDIGQVRTVPRGRFRRGTFEGNTDASNHAQALVREWEHRFDVTLGRLVNNGSNPVSSLGPSRHVRLEIDINIWTRLGATVAEDERFEQRSKVEQNAELAIQALSYRGNLETDDAGTPTGIVTCLMGRDASQSVPTYEVVLEDWNKQIHRSRILASAVIIIGQYTG